jgi:3-hydroxyisobutyrate dehydrogenase-like beta-hydroxyacid dehydrogenase
MGPPVKAASGDLTVMMAGGSDQVREKVIPLLISVVGITAIKLGQEDIAESLRLKVCGNFFITSVVEMVAEGMILSEAAGVGQGKVKELLDVVFPDTLLVVYAERMLENTYKDQIAASIKAAQKDVGHILQLAKNSGAKMPIVEIFLENTEKF